MADDNNDSSTPPPRQRRSSFAGETFANLFGAGRQRPSIDPASASPPNGQQYAGPISQAAAQAQRRRMSLTTLGLSGSPEGSRFPPYRGRNDSIGGSSNSDSIDESAIEEDNATRTEPTTPFARRMSFGAKALRDVRTGSYSGGSGGGGGGVTGQNGTKSPAASSTMTTAKAPNGTVSSRDAKGRGLSSLPESPPSSSPPHRYSLSLPSSRRYSLLTSGPAIGSVDFWNEKMRDRAQRTSFVGNRSEGDSLPVPSVPSASMHGRSKSVATMDTPPSAPRAIPKESNRPDHFQERILKGDFYMD